MLQEESESTRTTLETVQKLVAEEVQASLPEELIDQLGFKTLEWYRLGPQEIPANDLDIVFIGGQKGYDGGRSMPWRAALGAVAMTRIIWDGTVCPNDIRVSGICEDSLGTTRIMGTAYTAKEGKNAHQVGVSVTDREFPSEYRRLFGECHDLPNHPFGVAGIYTEVMMGSTRKRDSGIRTGVLEVHDPTFLGWKIHLLGLGSNHLGFSIDSSTSYHTVSRSRYREKKWAVSVPRRLCPV